MKNLQCHITSQQNNKVMKGTWNILMKYWKDMGYKCYSDIGNKIQWGLLELINFDFTITAK